MYVVQVVGYKNSGKTTFISQWIEYLTKKNYQVATIKHHGHGGEPDQVQETDGYQHFNQGAKVTTVVGENQLLITADKKKLPLQSLLLFYQSMNIDVVIIEGYKQVPLPKIALLYSKEDPLLEKVENVKYIYQENAEQLFNIVEANWHEFEFEKIKPFL
ncbi:molybdopterin-guanine dinucleotide biosynthesis protein B [Gracilibacillus orientalis]|uniref:Molybdopterin-guanine dinucleotide biosynthesis protein B n=1 Tax=Gracilibacillus orientalis TaxID=334253 RepID=A0A1I4QEM2_9BACI|nr:molybdopterin-guanine dinucleotide biosynthesis protein B [Gracilibacillus orientalis]SFM38474.1 molybdopterin-guanine dinucleotide biosynthesis protein B [Gracilibacillus orientalis]